MKSTAKIKTIKFSIFSNLFEQAHLESCPSRENFDRFIYRTNTDAPAVKSEPAKTNTRPNDDEEDWDHVSLLCFNIYLYS